MTIEEHLERANHNLDVAERNMRITVWIWKWLIIPMWIAIIVHRIFRLFN